MLLMDNAPIASKVYCQQNGWMCSEIFVRWLENFVHYTKASNENKVLVFLEGHKILEVLQYAEDNDVMLCCFPTHCNRLRPDVDIFLYFFKLIMAKKLGLGLSKILAEMSHISKYL
ncbi:hypothetical protein Zmor_007134 [Zophobas morio]|uniref:DDE-1 domain-containing protein n=1 Tax=Zophobas morio TaxID=2755281 RepID=A0AA38IW56_9CUCU|nr:hypothetical protein Zmor_007134 [Zophobas morio]